MQYVSSQDYPYFTYWIAIATINSFEGILQKKNPLKGREDIAMNFITNFSNWFGYTTMLEVIDRLSTYAHFIAYKVNVPTW